MVARNQVVPVNPPARRRTTVADTRPTAASDPAMAALEALVTELQVCIDQLTHAHSRAEHLLAERHNGRAWLDVVTSERRPLVVESISAVMASLASAGHAWRREQARALNAEDVSINRIAALFGVTRQRISALLRENDSSGSDEPDDDART
jgi:hypothetical protein